LEKFQQTLKMPFLISTFFSPAINQLCFRSVEHKKRRSSELLQQHLLFKSFYLAESFLFRQKVLNLIFAIFQHVSFEISPNFAVFHLAG
jgi:hypothetical protein